MSPSPERQTCCAARFVRSSFAKSAFRCRPDDAIGDRRADSVRRAASTAFWRWRRSTRRRSVRGLHLGAGAAHRPADRALATRSGPGSGTRSGGCSNRRRRIQHAGRPSEARTRHLGVARVSGLVTWVVEHVGGLESDEPAVRAGERERLAPSIDCLAPDRVVERDPLVPPIPAFVSAERTGHPRTPTVQEVKDGVLWCHSRCHRSATEERG